MEHNPVQALVPLRTFTNFYSRVSKALLRYIPAPQTHSHGHKAQQLQVNLERACTCIGSRKLGKQRPDLSNRQVGNSSVAKWHHSRHARRLPVGEGM